ncbi:MAG: ATP-binding cassette domain-containing protein [Sumerlaeia bacterium]
MTLVRDGVTILKNVSWRIDRGDAWLLFGPNGCGKTSLLNVICGYEWVTSGRVELFGETFGDGARIPDLRRRIGWVSSALSHRLNGAQSGLEVVINGPRAALRSWEEFSPAEKEDARAAMAYMGIEYLHDRAYGVSSQGERQRLMVARALVTRPELLILDEACAGLDPAAREDFLNDIEQVMTAPGAPTVIFVTHHLEEVRGWLKRALLLKKGEVVFQGERREALTDEYMEKLFERRARVVGTEGRYRLEGF